MPVTLVFCLRVTLLSYLLHPFVSFADAQRGVIESECRDRYLLVSVNHKITSQPLRIEAIDAAGVHPIDEKYAATCGYTYSEFSMDGYIPLRASYYSCHTENQNDWLFTFQFNIIATDHLGRESIHHVAKTCSLPLPWSDREVTCEEDYMEVTVWRDGHCTPNEAGDFTISAAPASAMPGWDVVFVENGQEVTMSVADTQALGYGLATTQNRVVFRSGYWLPHSKIVKVNEIPVVEIHTTVSFRQKWKRNMIDLSAACTINPGVFDETWRVFWEIPMVMAPLVYNRSEFMSKQVSLGVEGKILDESTWKARGYSMDIRGPRMHLSVPFGAEGGYRTRFVLNNTYNEFYIIYLYYEHVFMDGVLQTRHRMSRACSSPLMVRYPFTTDQTVLGEYVFTVYLGNFPSDVELVAVRLNAETFSISEAFQSGYTVSEIPHPNGTHAYIIKVPFEDRIVHRMYLGEGKLQYSLEINYTLNIMPQEEPYYHLASVVALIKDAFPPDFNAVCTERSIIFKMSHQNLGHVWQVTIGNYPLTPELAARRGYILQNNSQSLMLEVPVFTIGYIYEEITLNHFLATFEVLIRDAKSLDIQKSTAKRCLFKTEELIVCSTDGVMTVVASLAAAFPPVDPRSITLLDQNCKPWQSNNNRVLFAFGVNTCGTRVLVDDHYIVYENEIVSHRWFEPQEAPKITRDSLFRLTVQCFYHLNSTNRLFVDKRFKSETPGFGSIKVEGSSPKEYVKEHESTPIHSDTTSHVSSSYSVSHSGSGVHHSGNHPNDVPSTHEGSTYQQAPNRVQLFSNYGAADNQNPPGHYVPGEGNGVTQHVSSHYRAPHTGTTKHKPSSTHPTSSPYSTDQSRKHPNRYSASKVHITNMVPGTHEGRGTQQSPSTVQPTLSNYGAVGPQNVPDTSEVCSTTPHVSSGSRTTHTGTTQYEPSSSHSTSSPYGTDQSRRHPNRYSGSQVHFATVGPRTHSVSNRVQPVLSSSGALGTQTVPANHGTSKGSSAINHIFNRYTAHNAGTTQHGLNSLHSNSSPYGAHRKENPPNGHHLTNVVSNTHEGRHTVHVPSIDYAVESTSVPDTYSNSNLSQHRSTHQTSGNDKPVPATYGLSQTASTLSNEEHPQDSRYYSSGLKAVSGLSGGTKVSSNELSKVHCILRSSTPGPSKFVHVRSNSHGHRTHARRSIKTGDGDALTSKNT